MKVEDRNAQATPLMAHDTDQCALNTQAEMQFQEMKLSGI
jgi:hypothetical protein